MSTQLTKLFSAMLAVGAGAAVAVTSAASLAQDKGFYIGGQAGVSLPEDSDYDVSGLNLEAELDTGWVGALGFGYSYGNGIRGEIEANYHANDVDNLSGAAASGGDVDAFALMINGYYDFYTGSKWQPYVGGGFGGAHVRADGATPQTGASLDDSDTAFAWQAMAGIAYAVSDTIRLTLGYRYFNVPDLEYTNSAGAGVETEYASHDFMLGVRFLFGAPSKPMPAPAAAPAPAPAPAPPPVAEPAPAPPPTRAPEPAPISRNFLVFFDWDRSNLTAEAQSIVRSAAAEARRAGSARIVATGHADRSGAVRYNQGLSMRRAIAVRTMLEQLGIPRSEIVIRARGEEEPLVPTADGVREPQNRRVEIVLQ